MLLKASSPEEEIEALLILHVPFTVKFAAPLTVEVSKNEIVPDAPVVFNSVAPFRLTVPE